MADVEIALEAHIVRSRAYARDVTATLREFLGRDAEKMPHPDDGWAFSLMRAADGARCTVLVLPDDEEAEWK